MPQLIREIFNVGPREQMRVIASMLPYWFCIRDIVDWFRRAEAVEHKIANSVQLSTDPNFVFHVRSHVLLIIRISKNSKCMPKINLRLFHQTLKLEKSEYNTTIVLDSNLGNPVHSRFQQKLKLIDFTSRISYSFLEVSTDRVRPNHMVL